jgi:hypothetical protein
VSEVVAGAPGEEQVDAKEAARKAQVHRHVLGRTPAELVEGWTCSAAGLTLQDLLHWLVTGMALSEPPTPPRAPPPLAAASSINQLVPRLSDLMLQSSVATGVGAGELLRTERDHQKFDEVLATLERYTIDGGNFSLAAAALRSRGGTATHGHAKASTRWAQIEDACPDAWASLANINTSVSAVVHDGLKEAMLAFIAAAREMKTLIFAEALDWNNLELLERRTRRASQLPRHR